MAHRVLAIFRRRLLNGLTILSLLLCLATLALWVRSYWRYDALLKFSSDARSVQSFGMWSTWGELTLYADSLPVDLISYEVRQGWIFRTSPSSAELTIANYVDDYPKGQAAHFLGFGFAQGLTALGESHYVAPHWFIALLFATLPALTLRSLLRTRRRNRIGLCPHCGYDLRATPPDARCPECGQSRKKDEGVNG